MAKIINRNERRQRRVRSADERQNANNHAVPAVG